jgi:hypothetical protein
VSIKKVITTLRLRCNATFGTVEPDTDVSRRVRAEIAALDARFRARNFATGDPLLFNEHGSDSDLFFFFFENWKRDINGT